MNSLSVECMWSTLGHWACTFINAFLYAINARLRLERHADSKEGIYKIHVRHRSAPIAGIAQWCSAELRAGWSGVRVSTEARNFCLHHHVQIGSGGLTQPPILWVPGALSLGVKWPGSEADHSLPGQECLELYIHSHTKPSWRGDISTGTILPFTFHLYSYKMHHSSYLRVQVSVYKISFPGAALHRWYVTHTKALII
jgi:hypothetical protein